MSGVQTKTVSPDEAGMRLDRWFKTHFPNVRHGELEKFLRKGQVRVSGGRVKSNRRLETGEEIRIPPLHNEAVPRARTEHISEKDIDAIRALIIYEDDAILALNKPFGLAVQGGTKTDRHVDGMLGALAQGNDRPRLVHRLDKDTGGLMLVAKTRKAAQRLGDAFQRHEIDKTYWALTMGVPELRAGTIDLAIAKSTTGGIETVVATKADKPKRAISDYQIIDEAGPLAFLAMRPITGRTHQLRVHAVAIDCPIVGDGKYGGERAHVEGVSPKLHLFCREMTFRHPESGKRTTLSAPLTGHMRDTWDFFSFDKKAQCQWPELEQ